MGVKDLWGILSPSCEKKSLWELEGQRIAIDLSSWIVDSQNIGDNSQMNMYLRNLFFRTSYLLLLGVKPVFVLEGKAPTLKHGTIARRIQIASESQTLPKSKNGQRGRLNCLQKRCEELLLTLGVKCYRSEGEAEALCARLNELGMVDAVISQDSDCFLYGARTVLRNFTMSPTYTCDMYSMDSIETRLSLGRHKLLALSLICGCDYEAGVQGVGKQLALKFLATLRDNEVLDRLRGWRYANDTSSPKTQEEKLEQKLRMKALQDPNFPSEDVIAEFLLNTYDFDLPTFVWSTPSLPKFIVLADRMLRWEEDYSKDKFLPLLTRWHLTHKGEACGLKLETIVKKRSVRGVASYELQWHMTDVGSVTTVEPVALVSQVYSDQHNTFVKSKEKPKKKTQDRRKKTQNKENDVENVEDLLSKLDISKDMTKQPNKKRAKQKNIKGLQTLDKFLLKEIPSSSSLSKTLADSNVKMMMSSTPIRKEINTSCHYLSDESVTDSPLRKPSQVYKRSKSLEDIVKEVMKSNDSAEEVVQSEDNVKLVRSNDNLEKNLQFNDSFSVDFNSFLEDTVMDESAFNLSNIVDSILARTDSNPAYKIWCQNYK